MSELPARTDSNAVAPRQAETPSLEPRREPHRHPSLGLAPVDMTAGFPAGAERIRIDRTRLAGRALEAAIGHDPTIETRYDELGLRRLVHDAELLIDRLSRCVASGDPHWAKAYAEETAIVYRRRRVPMRDLLVLLEGIRDAAGAVLGPDERAALDVGIDGAEQVYEWNGRLAGDARKRNPLLDILYRGA